MEAGVAQRVEDGERAYATAVTGDAQMRDGPVEEEAVVNRLE